MPSEIFNEATAKTTGNGTKKKTLSKKGGSSNKLNELLDNNTKEDQQSSIIRDGPSDNGSGGGSRNILMGYYGTRGERIRHTIHDDALQMPKASWDIMNQVTQGTGLEPSTKYKLPALDGVLRPCLDPHITKLTITNLEIEKVEVVQPPPKIDPAVLAALPHGEALPQPSVIKVLQTKVQNRVVRRSPVTAALEAAEAQRIRGGGGTDGDTDEAPPASTEETAHPTEQEQQQQPVEAIATDNPPTLYQEVTNVQPPGQIPPVENQGGTTENLLQAGETSESAPVEAFGEQQSSAAAEPTTTQQPVASASTSAAPAVAAAATAASPIMDSSQSEDATDKAVPMETEPSTGEDALAATTTTIKPAAVEAPSSDEPLASAATVDSTAAVDPASSATVSVTNGADASPPVLPEGAGTVPPIAAPVSTEEAPPTASPTTFPASVAESTSVPDNAASRDYSSSLPTQPPSIATQESTPVTASIVPQRNTSVGKVLPPAPAPSLATADTISSTDSPPENSVKEEDQAKQEPPKTEEKKEIPAAQALPQKPDAEWEQHKPGSNDDGLTPKDQLPERPDWYDEESISDMERSMLPEWFDSSSLHRTPESYLETREKIIKMSDTIANRNVTNAMIRRVVVGDAGSLQRLRTFLVNWGVINEDAVNDTTPTPSGLRPNLKRPKQFSEDMRGDLITAVVEQAKRRKLDQDGDGDETMGVESSSSSFIPIDWDEIADQVGHGASAEECQQNFLMESIPKEEPSSTTERPITPDATQESSKPSVDQKTTGSSSSSSEGKGVTEKDLVQRMVAQSSPSVLKAMVDAAMKATGGNLIESQAASLVGLQLSSTIEEARGHEVDLAARLSKLVDARMEKLENRMAMMDDVESILEAEKVALELERRDLYTARCRHWFGGL